MRIVNEYLLRNMGRGTSLLPSRKPFPLRCVLPLVHCVLAQNRPASHHSTNHEAKQP